jgi:hydroxyacylglutathione hydrolase
VDAGTGLELFVTPGLGDNSYLLVSGDEGVLVDPQRDVWRMLAAAENRGARIRYVVETHVHNDYVSGAAEARVVTGAEVVGPADGGFAFPFVPMEDGAELSVGDLRLLAIRTPGHTPEHTSYGVLTPGDERPSAVFSGGSLIAGTAGRTDLLGEARAEELTRAQFRTMRRFDNLPDATLLLPTHGAGSFCASGAPQEDRTSTIGRERLRNPALIEADEEAFLRQQLTGLLAYPSYYRYMAPINRGGAPVLGEVPSPRPLSADEAAARIAAGARLVDARTGASFASAHVPGSLNVPLEDSFGSYVGWLLPFDSRLVLLADDEASLREASVQLCRIGFDEVDGYLDGGVGAWIDSGRRTSSYPLATVADLAAAVREHPETVLDVRQRTEWEDGHLPGSRHCFVGDLSSAMADLSVSGETLVACASGYRSAMAASLLHASGVPVRLVATGGVPAALRRLR